MNEAFRRRKPEERRNPEPAKTTLSIQGVDSRQQLAPSLAGVSGGIWRADFVHVRLRIGDLAAAPSCFGTRETGHRG